MERTEEPNRKNEYMGLALTQASYAAALSEVPIGCVIVKDDSVIASGFNRRNTDKNTLAHAEIRAIREACKALNDWRLEGCTMYVTLEPCSMCAGALIQSRIDKVVIGAMNPKAGCAGSIIDLFACKGFNHKVELEIGVRETECKAMLEAFFADLRADLKVRKEKNEVLYLEEILTGEPFAFDRELWEETGEIEGVKRLSAGDLLIVEGTEYLLLGECKDRSLFLKETGNGLLYVTASAKGKKESLAFGLLKERTDAFLAILPWPEDAFVRRLKTGRGTQVKDPRDYRCASGEKLFRRLNLGEGKMGLDERPARTV